MRKPLRKKKSMNYLLKRRAFILLSLQIAGVSVLGWKIRNLQIEDSARYKLLAEKNRVNIRLLPPIRGRIYDLKGNILANNQQNYKITITKEEAGDPKKVLAELVTLKM